MSYRDLSSSALENLVALVKSKMDDLAVAIEFGELLEADKCALQVQLAEAHNRESRHIVRIAERDSSIAALRDSLHAADDNNTRMAAVLSERNARIVALEAKLTAIWDLVAPEPVPALAPAPDDWQVAETSIEETAIPTNAPENVGEVVQSKPVAPLALCDLGMDQLHIFPSDHVPDGAVVLRNLHEPIEGFPVWDWVLGELVREVDGELETFETWQAMSAWKLEAPVTAPNDWSEV